LRSRLLQTRAHSGLQIMLEGVQEHASKARQAASDRLEVAKAANNLLSEGGLGAEEVLLAKDATHDAADADFVVASVVGRAVHCFENSVLKLETPAVAPELSAHEWDALTFVRVKGAGKDVAVRAGAGMEHARRRACATCA